jgi:hypothetical protein
LWGTLTDREYSYSRHAEDNLKDTTPNLVFSFSIAEFLLTMNNVFLCVVCLLAEGNNLQYLL